MSLLMVTATLKLTPTTALVVPLLPNPNPGDFLTATLSSTLSDLLCLHLPHTNSKNQFLDNGVERKDFSLWWSLTSFVYFLQLYCCIGLSLWLRLLWFFVHRIVIWMATLESKERVICLLYPIIVNEWKLYFIKLMCLSSRWFVNWIMHNDEHGSIKNIVLM